MGIIKDRGEGLGTLAKAALAGTLALSGLAGVAPSVAMADVYDTDVVYGKTILERSLNHEYAPSILAPSAILIDTDGITYFERSSGEERKVASTTKLMTALVAMENGNPDDIINVTEEDVVIGSTANLMAGDQLTLDHALYGLLLPSGNDAAMAIARSIGVRLAPEGGDPYVAFVDRMNSRAQELGMENTVFRNPSGLDVDQWAGDQHSTAADMAKLMEACLSMDEYKENWLRAILHMGYFEITVTNNGVERKIPLTTTDDLVNQSDQFIGGKTGQTDLARCCFVGAYEHSGKTYISVVLGDATRDESFNDTSTLLQWVVAHERPYQLEANDGTVTDDGRLVIAEIPHAEWIDVTIPLAVESTDATVYAFDLNGEVEQRAHFEVAKGDISEGDVLGAIELRQNDEVIDTLDLVATKDVPRPSVMRGLFIGVERFFRNLRGEPIVAEVISHFGTQTPSAAAGSGESDDADEADEDVPEDEPTISGEPQDAAAPEEATGEDGQA